MDFNILRSNLEQERLRLIQKLEQLEAHGNSRNERGGSWFGERDEQSHEASESRSQVFLEKNLREHLPQVECALHKFDEGTYGLCDDCRRPIDLTRLQVLPHANLCLNCKALREGKD